MRRLAADVLSAGSVTFFVRDVAIPIAIRHQPGLQVRAATVADTDALVRATGLAAELVRDRFARGDRCFLALTADEHFAAWCWLTRSRTYIPELDRTVVVGAGAAYAYDAYTRPDLRGRGILGLVRHAILEHLRTQPCSRLYSYVRSDSRANVASALAWQRPAGRLRYVRLAGRYTLMWGHSPLTLLSRSRARRLTAAP